MDQQESADTQEAEDVGRRRPHPNSLANLMPPWKPGEQPRRLGSPPGLARDGMSARDYPLREALRAKARKRRELLRLVDAWWENACEGNGTALAEILKRLDPIEDDAGKGRVVLEGLRLELAPGLQALAVARTPHVTPSSPPLMVTSGGEGQGGESVVVERPSESREGGGQVPALPLLPSPSAQGFEVTESTRTVESP